MRVSNEMLEVLGDYFVENDLTNKGWKFHEFLKEWQQGTIIMNTKK